VFLLEVDAAGFSASPLIYDGGGDETPVSILPGDGGGYLIGGWRKDRSDETASEQFILRTK
jgi:hypothetical protein